MDPDTKIHVIEATHWDREWRFPFEMTRMKPVSYTHLTLPTN